MFEALKYPYGIIRHDQELLAPNKRLRVFDFDDTLVHTNSHITVIAADGTTDMLTSGEYAIYNPKPGDTFDFSDFNNVVEPRQIKWVVNIMRRVYMSYGPAGMVILTARATYAPIRRFFKDIDMPNIFVVALADADPQKKADYIEYRILDDGLEYVEFFDDSKKNIDAVGDLMKKYPNVKIVTRHVIHA